jgi:rRNA processing/ribosome biogenesis
LHLLKNPSFCHKNPFAKSSPLSPLKKKKIGLQYNCSTTSVCSSSINQLAMANQDQLQGLLGQLADENRIESNLPFVLESISHNRYFDDESSDLSKFHKWITRLNSLLHSKNSTARWASISLIKATCEQSSTLYHANVASWVLNILNILTVRRFPLPLFRSLHCI